ncbi:TonB-dependent siderophore receptor [Collimonas pratensis]|uniref:TonB dependent receptor family protein n=1 Tax=Collimonas pratensis TaxID=279113 RepID=A0ABM5Z573_9BURK|nr:TonB-dependent receptor [Collimonas pratensis]AMP14196.1 tonB dependent receptor family protein [Collimonas pratensis]
MVLQNSRQRILDTSRPLSIAMRLHVACWCLASAGFATPQLACAQAMQLAKNYTIGAGKLSQVLAVFAARAGISLVYDPALVLDKVSPGLSGNHALGDAFARLLSGTGLEAVAKAEGGYALRPKPASPPLLAPQPLSAANAQAAAAGARDDAVLMELVVVPSNEPPAAIWGVAAASSSATRTSTPLAQIPQSVQVVTQDILASQQSQSVLDALHDVSGVNIYNRGVATAVYIRGFLAPARINGLAQGPSLIDDASSPLHTPLAAIDRIEVLKGADSIVANGDMEPGGLVNIITKQPQAEPVRQLTVETGTQGHQRVALDLAGALSEDQVWTHRTILSASRDADAIDRYDSARDLYFAPSLGYRHDGTVAVAGISYQRNLQANEGLGPLGVVDDGLLSNSLGASFDLQQKLGSGWGWQSKGNYMRTRLFSRSYDCDPSGVGRALRTCQPQALESISYGWNLENSLHGSFHTGPFKHTVLAGMALNYSWRAVPMAETGAPMMATLERRSLPEVPAGNLTPAGPSVTLNYNNWFVQDQMAWRRWHFLANLGYTRAWSHSTDPYTAEVTSLHPLSKPVYNIGLSYQLSDKLSLYLNRQKSFVLQAPTAPIRYDGGPPGLYNLPSTDGKSLEAGIKLSMLDERLLLTVSAFRASHAGVLYSDGSDSSSSTLLQAPTISRGVEFDLNGSPLPGWNLTAAYSYTDFSYGLIPGFDVISSLIARHQASFWSSYDLQTPAWRGWGYGVGATARGGYPNNSGDHIGGQVAVDGNLRYANKLWSLTLGVRNLLNRRLYGSFANLEQGIGFEPGRVFVLTGRYNF